MRILQLDVHRIEYRIVKPESDVHEEVERMDQSFDNVIVLLTTIEAGDTDEIADKAISNATEFAKRQKSGGVLIYPFAHLSDNLEDPRKALNLIKRMRERESDVKIYSAPFGWNKSLKLDVKGYPLAEQSKHYSAEGDREVDKRKPRGKAVMDTSILKKSDWSGLADGDHRSIGDRLDLYSAQEISPGMVYWHPRGYIIYRELVRMLRERYEQYEYLEISTPTLANVALWHVSGHYEHYNENMFAVDYESGMMGMKPMNCPSTIMIYKTRKWSYRELPFRTVVFDRLYRKELSGTLGGLLRVQEMTQDDGHIFVREDQLESEISSIIRFISEVYGVFGMRYITKISTKDPNNYMGDDALWERATDILRRALGANGLEYGVKEGDASFYGPKIDFSVIDSANREWQCATIQLDYQLPLRFGITYTGEDGKEHSPVLIHRAALGSLERFIGVMIEHYAGNLPLWLSPEQVRIIPISEGFSDYAERIYRTLRSRRIRANLDRSDKTLDYRIRDAKMHKLPYIIIVGKNEMESNTITVRSRSGNQVKELSPELFLERIIGEIESRSNTLSY